MIFNTDSTLLSNNVAVAEGYDCSIGTALALVDSARNDRAMFEAMLSIEAQSLQLESSGYTNESSEVSALRESAASGIFKKIADILKKFAAKVKAIFQSFYAKIAGFIMKDKDLVKKYKKTILLKDNLDKLEIKWREPQNGDPAGLIDESAIGKVEGLTWKEEKEDRDKDILGVLGLSDIDPDNITEEVVNKYLKDEEKSSLKELGLTPSQIIKAIEDNVPKKIKKLQDNCNKLIRKITSKANEYDKKTNKSDISEDDLKAASHTYQLLNNYQDIQLKVNAGVINEAKLEYKYTKAAFMKMVTVNDKKLAESAVWADAIAEAAEEEVTSVMDKAISAEEISDVNNASKAVMDADVSNDPEKLTYSDDPEYVKDTTDGTVDTNIVGTEESALFSEMFY